MDYIIANAKEIMMLCFGVGFVILILVVSRSLIIATRLMKKIDDLTDLTIHYINKPLSLVVQAEKSINKFLKKLNK